MRGDDDEDPEQSTAGTIRYPCMPSLVALQQMRNRLHMANLGKRLMKWTALATGREMRKIAVDINHEYDDFKYKVTDAFILLARCRYFYPQFSQMVLQNVQQKPARVTVNVTTRSIAGCKFFQFDVQQAPEDPYVHMGISRGGEIILETKRYWYELLRKLIVTLNLRTAFNDVDFAHKSATKKMNVLGRIVIPRTNHSIAYILSEMEELAREEFFRIKKVKNIKMRRAKHAHEEIELTCPVCLKILEAKRRAEVEAKEKCLTCLQILQPEDKKPPTEEELEAEKQKLEDLKTRLAEVVALQKSIQDTKIITASMEEFLLDADDIREKLEARIKEEEEHIIILPPDTPLDKLCLKCRKKVKEGDLLPEFIPEVEGDGEHIEVPDQETKITVAKQKTKQDAELQHIFVHPIENPDIELGVFETETKVITKIIRTRNEDGTITEERKVVKLRKEVKAPKKSERDAKDAAGQLMYQNSQTSQKSNKYPDSKTIGRLEVNQEITKTQFSNGIEEITSIDNLSNSISVTPKNSKIDFDIFYNNKSSVLENILATLKDSKFDTHRNIDDFLKLFDPLSYLKEPSTSTGVGLDNIEPKNETVSIQYDIDSTAESSNTDSAKLDIRRNFDDSLKLFDLLFSIRQSSTSSVVGLNGMEPKIEDDSTQYDIDSTAESSNTYSAKMDIKRNIDDSLKLLDPLSYIRQPSTSTGIGSHSTAPKNEDNSTQYDINCTAESSNSSK